MRNAPVFLEQLYVIRGKMEQSDLNRHFARMRTRKEEMALVSAHAQERVSE